MKVDNKKVEIELARNKMSRLELAEASGVSLSMISKMLTGNYKSRSATVGKIAEALAVDVTEIIKE